jgi:hypothetical protein
MHLMLYRERKDCFHLLNSYRREQFDYFGRLQPCLPIPDYAVLNSDTSSPHDGAAPLHVGLRFYERAIGPIHKYLQHSTILAAFERANFLGRACVSYSTGQSGLRSFAEAREPRYGV